MGADEYPVIKVIRLSLTSRTRTFPVAGCLAVPAVALTLVACVRSEPAASNFARFFFSADRVSGMLEVQTSPPSICYDPVGRLSIVGNPQLGPMRVLASFSPQNDLSTFCDRSIDPMIVRGIIDHPDSYAVRWQPTPGGAEVVSLLRPQGTPPAPI